MKQKYHTFHTYNKFASEILNAKIKQIEVELNAEQDKTEKV